MTRGAVRPVLGPPGASPTSSEDRAQDEEKAPVVTATEAQDEKGRLPVNTDYVIEYQRGIEYVENLGGVGWYDAPNPPKRHKCWPQTRAFMDGAFVQRCPCGAINLMHSGWIQKNGDQDDFGGLDASWYAGRARFWLKFAVVVGVIGGVIRLWVEPFQLVGTFLIGSAIGAAINVIWNLYSRRRAS